ncbi:MAG: carbamoylphosphate synthase large subunit [Nonomuraea sp.]|nr:carbamoylphosphate synthase large subunit [Nonomuraea sp.]
MTVLITGARAPVALDLARKFHRSGVRVVTADSAAAELCRSSNAVSRSHRVPPPRQAPDAYADALVEIVRQESVDLIVPTCEEIFYVSRARDRLLEHCDVLAAPLETMRRLHSKWEFVRLAQEFGLPVPDTTKVRNVVVKPEYSRFGTRVSRLRGEHVAQELLEGSQTCTYSVVRDGVLKAHVAYAVDFTASGACVSFQPTEAPAVDAWVSTFVGKLGFTGQISFDFIGDLPLECNPRATSGVHLLGDGLARVLQGQTDGVLRADPRARRMLAAAMLSFGLAGVRSARDLRRWAAFVATARDVVAEPGDRGPFAAQFGVLWSNWLRSLWTRRSIIECSTYDIEWNGP